MAILLRDLTGRSVDIFAIESVVERFTDPDQQNIATVLLADGSRRRVVEDELRMAVDQSIVSDTYFMWWPVLPGNG